MRCPLLRAFVLLFGAMACASTRPERSEEHAATPVEPPPTRDGARGANLALSLVTSRPFDVAIETDPLGAAVEEDESHFRVSNMDQGSLTAGLFSFTVVRREAGKSQSAHAVAGENRKKATLQGADVSDVEPTVLLGMPAVMFAFRKDRTFGMTLVAVHRGCGYYLMCVRRGAWELKTFADRVLGALSTPSGGAPRGSACD